MRIRVRLRAARPADLLAIYVRDHLAGAAGGLALVRRAAGTAQHPAHRRELRRLAREVAGDVDALRRCASGLGIERSRSREALAIGAEWVGRGKLNGQLLGRSPLSPLIEVEALILAATGQESCWRVLGARGVQQRLPHDVDLEVLARRARTRRQDLLRIRDDLAAGALGRSAGVVPGG